MTDSYPFTRIYNSKIYETTVYVLSCQFSPDLKEYCKNQMVYKWGSEGGDNIFIRTNIRKKKVIKKKLEVHIIKNRPEFNYDRSW